MRTSFMDTVVDKARKAKSRQALRVMGVSLAGSLLLLWANLLPSVQAEVKQAGVKVYQSWGEGQTSDDRTSRNQFTNQFPDRQWWESFQDRQLNAYIQAAIQNSPSIQIAVDQVEASRALARQALAQSLPSLNLNPSTYRLGLPSGLTQQLPLDSNTFLYNLPLQLSYELDWFGKNRNVWQSAKKQADATEWQSKAVLNAVLGEVSAAYINLIRTDALIENQHRQVALLNQIAALEQSRLTAGLTDTQTALEAERNALEAQNGLKTLQAQQAVFSHQLAILTGSPPAVATALDRGSLEGLSLPTETPAGLPNELLTRRPDVLAEEALLQSARIDVQVARKAFLPTLNLGALVGTGSLQFSQLWKGSNVFNVQSLLLNQPVFRGGQLSSQLNYRKAKQKEALDRYRMAVLTALKEVEDSLSHLKASQAQLTTSTQQLALTQQRVALAESLQRQGLISKLDALRLESERARYQQTVWSQKADTAITIISLYKALGGGF